MNHLPCLDCDAWSLKQKARLLGTPHTLYPNDKLVSTQIPPATGTAQARQQPGTAGDLLDTTIGSFLADQVGRSSSQPGEERGVVTYEFLKNRKTQARLKIPWTKDYNAFLSLHMSLFGGTAPKKGLAGQAGKEGSETAPQRPPGSSGYDGPCMARLNSSFKCLGLDQAVCWTKLQKKVLFPTYIYIYDRGSFRYHFVKRNKHK